MALHIAALDAYHDVVNFDCGTPELNRWLQTTARQHQKKLLSQTFVLVDDAAADVILGYYALAMRGLMPTEALPPAMVKRLPLHIPTLTLARLAVATHAQRSGHGEHLLVDAMARAKQVAAQVGGNLLFVDAKDAGGARFYAKYGFQSLPSDPLILCLAVASIPD